MSTTTEDAEANKYRIASAALAVVDQALRSKTLMQVADELGVSRQAIQSWRTSPNSTIRMVTARLVRRMARRMK